MHSSVYPGTLCTGTVGCRSTAVGVGAHVFYKLQNFKLYIFDERFYFDTLDTQYSHVFLREGYVYPVLILKFIYMAFMCPVPGT